MSLADTRICSMWSVRHGTKDEDEMPLLAQIDATVRQVPAKHVDEETIATSSSTGKTAYDLFHSARVEVLKAQIVAAGQRLWRSEFIGGNGGNISARINDGFVLCIQYQQGLKDLVPASDLIESLLNKVGRPPAGMGLTVVTMRTGTPAMVEDAILTG